ncbi:hypothetical protein ABIB00_003362 [Bradyrhizobium sp. LB14.3]
MSGSGHLRQFAPSFLMSGLAQTADVPDTKAIFPFGPRAEAGVQSPLTRRPYSLSSVQLCSPHWHLNMRTIPPVWGLSIFIRCPKGSPWRVLRVLSDQPRSGRLVLRPCRAPPPDPGRCRSKRASCPLRRASQLRCRRRFLMISRRSSAYSSMMRRASSKREGLGSGASLCGPGSSDWLMPKGSPRTTAEC